MHVSTLFIISYNDYEHFKSVTYQGTVGKKYYARIAFYAEDSEGNEKVEVLECPWAKPGTPVVLKGAAADAAKPEAIDADTFFAVQIAVAAKKVGIHGTDLVADGKEIVMQHVENGEVC